MSDGAKFCMQCGTRVEAAPVAAPAPVQPASDGFEVSQPDENTLSFNVLGIPFNLKFIKGGMMGEVEISDFYIGETVVTQALWQTVTGSNPSKDNGDLQFPVTNLNKQLVKTFLTRLKKITGINFDVPTCSQFKYAALNGCEKMDASAFEETRWGDGQLHPVCGMMPDNSGLYDLPDWGQFVMDNVPQEEKHYRFNPKYEFGEYGASLAFLSVVDVSPQGVGSSLTLRLVLNIPVDPEIEKVKEMKEKQAYAQYEESLRFLVRRKGRFGYIDKSGREVIPCKYDDACSFLEGLALVKVGDKWGFIDKTGREVIPCKYDDAWPHFHEGLAVVKVGGKCGYIDRTGREVMPCKYDYAKRFHEGLALVKAGNTWGFIDKGGREVISCKYDEADYFHEGLAVVKVGDKWGFIDKTGREVIPCKYDFAWDFHGGLARIDIDGELGFIDRTGREVIPCQYVSAGDFHEDLAKIEIDDEWGYIDKTGREVIPCKYDVAWDFHEGLAEVMIDGDMGFINKTGREVVPCKYDVVRDFHEGLAAVEIYDKKYGYIDKTGREIIPCKYESAGTFHEGLAYVSIGGKFGYIEKTGRAITPFIYDSLGK